MGAQYRTYWLTRPARIRRKDQSLLFELADGQSVHVPVTDVSDIVALEAVDINTAAVSLLKRHDIVLHLLDHYGNYAGTLLPPESSVSGEAVRRQVLAAEDRLRAVDVARSIVKAAAFNVRWVIDKELLNRPFDTLRNSADSAMDTQQLMGAEANFRRAAWAVLDTKLPPWLRLEGRSRRPPTNAGNAFISFVNGIVYARAVTAIRLTPLHTGVGFLHTTTDRRRHTLALDLAEPFKPLFSERLLLRIAHQNILHESDFETDLGASILSELGRRKVTTLVRDELAKTVHHRALRRNISYDGLIQLEPLKILRHCLEGSSYKPFKVWW